MFLRFRSVHSLTNRSDWLLTQLHGEPAHPGAPACPSPEFSPEAIVAAQVEALRHSDVKPVYDFRSLSSVLGTAKSLEHLAATVASDRRYARLLGHSSSTSIRRMQRDKGMYLEIVTVHHRERGSAAYCWVMQLQDSGDAKDCWLTASIEYINDPKVLSILNEKFRP